MKKFVLVMSLIFALSFVLAACGGSGGSSSGGATTSKVTMSDFMFEPKEISVTAGKQVSLTIENTGAVDHNFIVLSKTVTAPFDEAANKDAILFQVTVAAGQTQTASFTAPAAGTYQVICGVPGHLDAGMEAKLISK